MSEPVSDSQARDALRAAGFTPGARGRLSAADWDNYHQLPGGHVTDIGDPLEQTSTFADDELVAGPPGQESTPVDAEQRPRRVASSAPGLGDRVKSTWARRPRGAEAAPPKRGKNAKPGARGKPRGGKPDQPWRPTGGIITNVWTRMAQAASGLPPLQRILAAQAPLAGAAFESQLRGTFVDRLLLQPAARIEARSDVAAAMVGVPGLVLAAFMFGKVQMATDPDGAPLVTPDGATVPLLKPDGTPLWEPQTEAVIIMPLKMCLASWMAVQDRYAADVIEQAEATIRKGEEAEKLLRWIFQTGAGPADPAEAAARGEAFMHGEPQPGPGYGPWPPSQPDSGPPWQPSAFRPAITASVLPS